MFFVTDWLSQFWQSSCSNVETRDISWQQCNKATDPDKELFKCLWSKKKKRTYAYLKDLSKKTRVQLLSSFRLFCILDMFSHSDGMRGVKSVYKKKISKGICWEVYPKPQRSTIWKMKSRLIIAFIKKLRVVGSKRSCKTLTATATVSEFLLFVRIL